MNILFRASAGTGKTWQVSSLYTALVLGQPCEAMKAPDRPARRAGRPEPIPPDRIVLMTFTDNAAAELRLRVTARVLDARQKAAEQNRPAEAELAARVLRSLPGAPICTIHSFCADRLRERALQAGLSPAFGILDEESAGALLDEAAREALLERLNRSSAHHDADFAAFCRGMRVLGAVSGTAVLAAAQALLHQAAGKGLDLAAAESWLPPPHQAVTPGDFASICEGLRKARAERGSLPPVAEQFFQSLERNLKIFPIIGKNPENFSNDWKEEALEDFAAALGRDHPRMFTGKGLEDLAARLKAALTSVRNTAAYKRHAGAIRAFARYAAAVAASYAARKRALRGVDFDDLLIQARDLLAADRAAARRYDYILVDEAQDTSRIQCEILRRLWDPALNHLVLCGDTKQSIYTWRHADPRIMPDLEAAQRATKSFRSIALRTSFRSKDVILDAINPLFAGVYGEAYTEEDRLAPAPERGAGTRALGEGPGFELIEPAGEAEGSDREARARAEMNAVAERLRLLVDGPDAWRPKFRFQEGPDRFEPVSGGNRFRYADILVLLRSTTRQPLLEQALHRHGIPYRVGGRGRGLFARQEATDLLLLLKVLIHPCDTLALLGFLRSPWAALSDETLLQLGWTPKGFDEPAFRARVLDGRNAADLPELPGGAKELGRLAAARELIRKYAGQADRRPLAAIARDAIRETGFDAVLAATFRGEQRLANLDKLLAWLEQAGRTRLASETAAEMERLVGEPPDQAEAALLDPDQNVVTLMTIHGAKGLTAGVVVVPELGSPPRGGTSWALLADGPDERTGALHIRSEIVDGSEIRTPGYDAACERVKTVRDEEAKNLFYVALTRARDLVILTGAPSSKGRSKWLADLHVYLGEAPDLLLRRTYPEVSRALREAGLAARTAGRARPWPKNLPAPAGLFGSVEAACTPRAGPLPVLRYPATLLSAYRHDPAAFRPAPAAEREDDDDAAAFGTAGHEALEQAALSGWPAGAKNLFDGPAAAALGDTAKQDLRQRTERAARHLAGEARGWDLAAEWPFAIRLEHGGVTLIVDGTADLVLARGARRRVVDYKFSDEPPAALAARYGLQLNLYRLAVARRDGLPAEAVEASVLALRRDGLEVVDIPYEAGAAAQAVETAQALYAQEQGSAIDA